ncbi:SRPBCC family protein [Acuticoccus sediminis]|uniref:SRPBCC family protein n=1 Tax=Acuticoccus sediminis TaxID=2184697 RepID=UPI001CFD97AE|nr:SRPBCC family protein [Acuticoccus sediminis]
MSDTTTIGAYGVVTEPATFTIERLLPGPIERVWDYLTKSELRRQWLAAGDMTLAEGAPFEFVWRNDTLTEQPGRRPAGADEEHRLESRILEVDPPRKLVFTWMQGDVTFALEPKGERVLLTVIHRRVSDRENLTKVGAGWHTHLDILVAKLTGETPAPFWDTWPGLRDEYEKRIPA